MMTMLFVVPVAVEHAPVVVVHKLADGLLLGDGAAQLPPAAGAGVRLLALQPRPQLSQQAGLLTGETHQLIIGFIGLCCCCCCRCCVTQRGVEE